MKATGTKIFLQQDPRNSHLDVYPRSIPPLKRLKRWSLKVKNKDVNHQCFCLCLGSENIGIPWDQMHKRLFFYLICVELSYIFPHFFFSREGNFSCTNIYRCSYTLNLSDIQVLIVEVRTGNLYKQNVV